MKKIATDQVLLNFKGEELKERDEVATVGYVISNILSHKATNPHRSYQLAKAFATQDEVELKAEDVVYIKEEVLKSPNYTALVTGQIVEILES